MAGTISFDVQRDGVALAQWSALSGSETGLAATMAQFPDKSVQVSGTFTSIAIEGSNDGTNYSTLHDLQGAAISFTAAGIKQIAENTKFIRPNGTTVTSAVVTIVGSAGR